MKITHEEDLSILELGSDELGRAIRDYVRDHLPTEDRVALATLGLRPLRHADVYVSGQRLDPCSVRLLVRREAEVGAATPVAPERLTDRHVRTLVRASKIPIEDAVVAVGFSSPATAADLHAARARICSVWNDLLEKGLICSVVWRPDSACAGRPGRPWGRAVVVVHGDPPRDAHGSPDSQDRRRAERWAVKNHLVVVDDDPFGFGRVGLYEDKDEDDESRARS